MSAEQYATFRHEALVLLGIRHHQALLGIGKGLTVLALLYTGLRGDDGAPLLRRMDALALKWVLREQEYINNEAPCNRYADYVGGQAGFQPLRLDFIALVERYKNLAWRRCKTPGLSTAVFMSYCLRYESLTLPVFEMEALDLLAETAFRRSGDWLLWLHQGMACSACYKTDGPLVRCGGCLRVYYCSPQCQKAHRARHRPQCFSDH